MGIKKTVSWVFKCDICKSEFDENSSLAEDVMTLTMEVVTLPDMVPLYTSDPNSFRLHLSLCSVCSVSMRKATFDQVYLLRESRQTKP